MSCLLRLEDYENVLSLSTELLEVEPQNYKILSMKATAEYYSGNYEVALCFYHRGIRSAPLHERARLKDGMRNNFENLNSNVKLNFLLSFRRTKEVIGQFLDKKSSKRKKRINELLVKLAFDFQFLT